VTVFHKEELANRGFFKLEDDVAENGYGTESEGNGWNINAIESAVIPPRFARTTDWDRSLPIELKGDFILK